MPTAKSAAPNQPNHRAHISLIPPRRSRLRGLAGVGLGVLIGLTIVLPAQTFFAPNVAASAGPACPGYNSVTTPPAYIRVLRHRTGRVDKVPFRQYVLVVLGREWPGYLPQQAINAGAVAVKQYAWYHAVIGGRATRSGQCFDVTDGTGDQLYTPSRTRIRPDHYTALNATWGIRLAKSGSLFMTGYRTGVPRACGSDATGWKLYARSATRCAYRGDGFVQILHIYYGPVSVLDVAGSGGGSSAEMSADTSAGTAAETIPFTTSVPVSADAGVTGGVSADTTPADGSVPVPASAPIGELAFTSA